MTFQEFILKWQPEDKDRQHEFYVDLDNLAAALYDRAFENGYENGYDVGYNFGKV